MNPYTPRFRAWLDLVGPGWEQDPGLLRIERVMLILALRRRIWDLVLLAGRP